MTLPRRQIDDQIALISRRTHDQMPFLAPVRDGSRNNDIMYFFALYAEEHKIAILALQINEDGITYLVHDPHANRSKMMRDVHRMMSDRLRRDVNHRESTWENRKTSDVTVIGIDTFIETAVKIRVAPVKSGYVERAQHWNNPSITPDDWEKPFVFTRPDYLPKRFPASVKLTPGFPPHLLDGYTETELVDMFKKKLNSAEVAIQKHRHQENGRVKGMRHCYGMRAFKRRKKPTTREPKGLCLCSTKKHKKRFGKQMDDFWEEHRIAREEREEVKGTEKNEILFPAGTVFWKKFAILAAHKSDDPGLFLAV